MWQIVEILQIVQILVKNKSCGKNGCFHQEVPSSDSPHGPQEFVSIHLKGVVRALSLCFVLMPKPMFIKSHPYFQIFSLSKNR